MISSSIFTRALALMIPLFGAPAHAAITFTRTADWSVGDPAYVPKMQSGDVANFSVTLDDSALLTFDPLPLGGSASATVGSAAILSWSLDITRDGNSVYQVSSVTVPIADSRVYFSWSAPDAPFKRQSIRILIDNRLTSEADYNDGTTVHEVRGIWFGFEDQVGNPNLDLGPLNFLEDPTDSTTVGDAVTAPENASLWYINTYGPQSPYDYFGDYNAVPEPSSFFIAALGTLAGVTRRKRQ